MNDKKRPDQGCLGSTVLGKRRLIDRLKDQIKARACNLLLNICPDSKESALNGRISQAGEELISAPECPALRSMPGVGPPKFKGAFLYHERRRGAGETEMTYTDYVVGEDGQPEAIDTTENYNHGEV